MTRINAGIQPVELLDKHLLAETREIVRVPNLLSSIIDKNGRLDVLKRVPAEFTLNTGHVKFFYDKIRYLSDRYTSLRDECLSRGYNVSNYAEAFDNVRQRFPEFYNDWSDVVGRNLLLDRISERVITQKTEPRYYSKPIDSITYIDWLRNPVITAYKHHVSEHFQDVSINYNRDCAPGTGGTVFLSVAAMLDYMGKDYSIWHFTPLQTAWYNLDFCHGNDNMANLKSTVKGTFDWKPVKTLLY